MCFSVAPALEIGHEAIDNVRKWREDVYGVHVWVHGSFLVDLLDIGDVLVEDIIFFDDIVQDFAAVLIYDQDFPFAFRYVSYGFEDF